MLLTCHMAASKFLETPELQLAEEEAACLAAAGKRVAAEYNVEVNPKVAAWLGLAGAIGTVYGTRLYAIFSRKREAAAARQEKKSAANLIDIKVQARAGQAGAMSDEPARMATPADLFGDGYSGALAFAQEV